MSLRKTNSTFISPGGSLKNTGVTTMAANTLSLYPHPHAFMTALQPPIPMQSPNPLIASMPNLMTPSKSPNSTKKTIRSPLNQDSSKLRPFSAISMKLESILSASLQKHGR